MCNDGELYLYSTREETGSLRFTVDSTLESPVLEVVLNDQRLDGLLVNQLRTYTTRPFTLSQGMNAFRFHLPGGSQGVVDSPSCWQEQLLTPPETIPPIPCQPEEIPYTCRTMVFDHISFIPQGKLLSGEALDVSLGDQVRLRSWALEDGGEIEPGTLLTVMLTWEPEVPLSDQHVAFVHLVANDGTLVAQHDGPLIAHVSEPSALTPGAAFSHPVAIALPEELPPGNYRLLAGVYLWPSLERLPVMGDATDVVELGEVTIGP
jgi:hypothetical protein